MRLVGAVLAGTSVGYVGLLSLGFFAGNVAILEDTFAYIVLCSVVGAASRLVIGADRKGVGKAMIAFVFCYPALLVPVIRSFGDLSIVVALAIISPVFFLSALIGDVIADVVVNVAVARR